MVKSQGVIQGDEGGLQNMSLGLSDLPVTSGLDGKSIPHRWVHGPQACIVQAHQGIYGIPECPI